MKAEIHPEISTTMIISIAASENSPHANLSGQAPRGSPLSARKPDGHRTLAGHFWEPHHVRRGRARIGVPTLSPMTGRHTHEVSVSYPYRHKTVENVELLSR